MDVGAFEELASASRIVESNAFFNGGANEREPLAASIAERMMAG